MKKRYKILILVIFILSIIWCAFNINTYMHQRNWVTTTATITFVGLPDGVVIGTYTDINNHTHSDVTLYIDPFYKGYNANVDRLVGKKIDIIYNPLTGEVAKSNTVYYWISLFLFLLLSLSLCLCIKKPFTHLIKRQKK